MSSRTVLIPIDHSEHSEKAFDCEYCVYITPTRLRYVDSIFIVFIVMSQTETGSKQCTK